MIRFIIGDFIFLLTLYFTMYMITKHFIILQYYYSATLYYPAIYIK